MGVCGSLLAPIAMEALDGLGFGMTGMRRGLCNRVGMQAVAVNRRHSRWKGGIKRALHDGAVIVAHDRGYFSGSVHRSALLYGFINNWWSRFRRWRIARLPEHANGMAQAHGAGCLGGVQDGQHQADTSAEACASSTYRRISRAWR